MAELAYTDFCLCSSEHLNSLNYFEASDELFIPSIVMQSAGGLCFALLMLDFGELPLYVSSALRSVAASGAY